MRLHSTGDSRMKHQVYQTNIADVGIEALEAASERIRAVRVARVTIVVGLALLAGVCAYALTRAPSQVVRAGPRAAGLLSGTYHSAEVCQAEEVLPADVSAIRVSLAAYFGAHVRLTAISGSRLVAEGSRGPEWTATSVTIRVKPLRRAVAPVTLCLDIAPNSESIYFFGHPTPEREAAALLPGGPIGGRLQVEYLRPGQGSWWSRITTVARHMGLGRVFSGTWIVLLIAAMVGAVGILSIGLTLRELP